MSTAHNHPADRVLKDLDSLLPDLEALYKDVHAHPELSMQESRTAGLAADRLRSAGYEVTTGVGKTGVVGLLRNGDRIIIDAEKGTIDVALSDAELAARRAAWQPRKTDYNSGAIWKYAQLVGPAHLGALTHPGAEAESHCYADI